MYFAALIVSLSMSAPAQPPAKAKAPDAASAAFEKEMAGAHLCGDHWNSYNEVCTLSRNGKQLRLTSEGPTSVMKGDLEVVSANEFLLHGELKATAAPIGMDDAAFCEEAGPYRFKRVGKRKYFRHVRTCPNMYTTYFDLFTAGLSKEKQQRRTKKLAELKGKARLLWPLDLDDGGCAVVHDAFLTSTIAGENKGSDVVCQRRNTAAFTDRGLYACDVKHPSEQDAPDHDVDALLLVFDRPKDCKETVEGVRRRGGG